MNINKLEERIIELSDDYPIATFTIIVLFYIFNLFIALYFGYSTFINENQILIIIGISFFIAILLTIYNFKLNSFIKKLWINKFTEFFIYFSIFPALILLLNFYISFETESFNFEVIYGKSKKNLLGYKTYSLTVCDNSITNNTGACQTIKVSENKFKNRGDYIDVKINTGIFGLKVIPKNQKTKSVISQSKENKKINID